MYGLNQRIRNIGKDNIHYGLEGIITARVCADDATGLFCVRWADESETFVLAKDIEEVYWTGYIYVSISSDKSFPPECVFHCLDGRLYTASGKAGCYRFESFKELFDRLASNGIYVMEVAGLYDEHTGKAKRGEDSDAGREDY
nr:MAG TPA: hypothetical protein [Caudoviricetes sp.]